MTFDEAAKKYTKVRADIDALERETKERKAPLNEKLVALENWFTAKAQEEGLKNIPTAAGLVYWSTHSSATVGSRNELFDHCKTNDTWELVEARVSSTAVKAYIEANGAPPPGVNFSTRQVFNFRAAAPKE